MKSDVELLMGHFKCSEKEAIRKIRGQRMTNAYMLLLMRLRLHESVIKGG